MKTEFLKKEGVDLGRRQQRGTHAVLGFNKSAN